MSPQVMAVTAERMVGKNPPTMELRGQLFQTQTVQIIHRIITTIWAQFCTDVCIVQIVMRNQVTPFP